MTSNRRILLVDLNHFARYPTPPIGLLAAVLRQAGHTVTVFSPLAVGVGGMARERPPGPLSVPLAKLNDRVARSSHPLMRAARDGVAAYLRRPIRRHRARVVDGVVQALAAHRPDAVLISAYLSLRDVCADICAAAKAADTPVMIGGPYFAQRSVVEAWSGIDGLTALVAGELELELPGLVDDLCERRPLPPRPGLHLAGAVVPIQPARALAALDDVPYPDYSDFAWPQDRPRIAPVLTGRGCSWGACSFCSDVTSTVGRRWRSRSPANVLGELAHHHERLGVRRFVFTDLKLNGDLQVWRAIHARTQDVVPQARWIGAVHVGPEADNGLSAADLQAAAASGCVRLTTGLETGSQRLADLMRKGTAIDRVGRFLRDASQSGISCRCTMISGYPGETAADVMSTVAFLEAHHGAIERVSLNRLQVVAGTVLDRALRMRPAAYPGVRVTARDEAQALVTTVDAAHGGRDHRRAMDRLIEVVDRINRTPLSANASDFDGVM